MRTEADYRKLLEKAQEATDQIEALLAAIGAAPRLDDSIQTNLERVRHSVRTLQGELDQLWDELSGSRRSALYGSAAGRRLTCANSPQAGATT